MAEPYFLWNGTSSASKNIIVDRYPQIVKPRLRNESVTVPGRPGTLTLPESDNAYDPVTIKAECFVETTADAYAAAAWLKGSGTVVFGNETGRSYRARIDNEAIMDQLERGQEPRSFTVEFVCQPYRYLYPAASDIEITSSGTSVTNPDNEPSEPLIKIEGTGDIDLLIGTQGVSLTGIDTGIYLDCEMKDAYDLAATELLNNSMEGDFPVLEVGANAISWTGTVSKITITPRWRCL